MVAFLGTLGGAPPDQLGLTAFEGQVPDEGDPGGPVPGLSDEDYALWLEGRSLFDRNRGPDDGMSPYFNADSCRACHQDPVLGGAGGIDTNVIRVGHWDGEGHQSVGFNVFPRVAEAGLLPLAARGREPHRASAAPDHPRGGSWSISNAAILAGEDPDDSDGDGISGRARILADGRLGRFGWKSQIPTVYDFTADALLQELGLTVDPAYSDFTVADDGDAHGDGLSLDTPDALAFYLENLGPPVRRIEDGAAVAAGEALFGAVGWRTATPPSWTAWRCTATCCCTTSVRRACRWWTRKATWSPESFGRRRCGVCETPPPTCTTGRPPPFGQPSRAGMPARLRPA